MASPVLPSTVIVVPFKDPTTSKQRLSEFLTPAQREELARELFRETLATLVGLPSRPAVLVVTNSPEVADFARGQGAEALVETESRGETAAVNDATRWSIERGYDRQIVIPGDMARLDTAEVERLLATVIAAPSVVLCPAVNDDGTNAIMTAPPDAVPFRFGKASFPEYLLRAAERGVSARVLRLESFVLDIDTPEDLSRFLADDPGTPVALLLRSWRLPEKTAVR